MNSRLVLIEHQNKRAWVYPEHGFQLYGFEEDLDKDHTVSVIYAPDQKKEPVGRRYGNPILFPNPSPSHSQHGPDTWVWQGQVLAIPSHGFARNMYWHVLDRREDRVTAELVPNTNTKLAFPFDFRLQLTYQLDTRGLVLEGRIENTGQEAFPYALGFHPYLNTPLGRKGGIQDCFVSLPSGVQVQSPDQWKTHSQNSFNARQIRCDEPLNPAILLLNSGSRQLELEDRANGLITRVSVAASEQSMGIWVVWSTSPETPYICLEPWTDFPNALNRSETRRCGQGQTHRYQMVISVQSLK